MLPEYTEFIKSLSIKDQEFFYRQKKRIETEAVYPRKYKREIESIFKGNRKEIRVINNTEDYFDRYYRLFYIYNIIYLWEGYNDMLAYSVASSVSLIGIFVALTCDRLYIKYKQTHYHKYTKYIDRFLAIIIYTFIYFLFPPFISFSAPNFIGIGMIYLIFIITTIIRMINGTLIPDTRLYQKHILSKRKI